MATKYDDASWHYGGDFPKNLAPEAGATHIGMFLAWAVLAGMGSEFLLAELAPDAVALLHTRQITPGRFLIDVCDEKFVDDLLNDDGNAFAKIYYLSELHMADYSKAIGGAVESLYEAADDWTTFDTLKPIFDGRFDEWEKGILRAGGHR
jgi:hypothetical protein